MFIKVTTKSEAVAALCRGETLWSLTTGEGWQICYPWQKCPVSKNGVRRFLSSLQRQAMADFGEHHTFGLRR